MITRLRSVLQAFATCLSLLAVSPPASAQVPVVSNLKAVQRAGTELVDIDYALVGFGGSPVDVTLEASANGGSTWTVPVRTVTGAIGTGVTAGAGMRMTWNAGADWDGQFSAAMRFRVTAVTSTGDLRAVSAGGFAMGDTLDGDAAAPVRAVTLGGFYMDRRMVTKGGWDAVKGWGVSRGYSDLAVGAGKGAEHPVVTVTWFDALKWCNARSEMEGLNPCYTVGGVVMRSGTAVPEVAWGANGYRLPTEAEWEKAARGGLSGKRFPWGDTITHGQANYYSSSLYAYDVSGTRGYNPVYRVGSQPWTAPAGTFPANGLGLHEMAGNVSQWCWDWFGDYGAGPVADPRGAAAGTDRVVRGGNWLYYTDYCTAAKRRFAAPDFAANFTGLRVVRGVVEILRSEATTGDVSVLTAEPVQITEQPADVTAVETSVVRLRVAATGTAPLSYRWRKNGLPMAGQTGAVLEFARVTAANAGSYSVAVSNVAGTVTSGTAVVTVVPALAANVSAAQRAGTKLVDIDYDVPGLGGLVLVSLQASADGGVTWNVPVRSVVGAHGGVMAGSGLRMTWDAGADWDQQYAGQMKFRVLVEPGRPGFVVIPPGGFTMGDALDGSEEPHEVLVSGFQMAQKTVTWAEWNAVRAWGASRGYSDLSAGEAKGDEHPVYSVSWSDAVKWSNARSEMDGLTPCYTVGGNAMKTGGMVPSVNWGASGYRLPTEAEWEKAARGGLSGKRFPWGDTITHGQANYYSMTGLEYDISATRAYHPVWAVGNQPWSAPAGSFAANGYGLYDMAGNGWQWCWDWFGPYDIELAEDPRGSASGSDRIFRGGGWGSGTVLCRTAFRGYYPPVTKNNQIGFRVVRNPSPAFGPGAVSGGTVVSTSEAPTVSEEPVDVTVTERGTAEFRVTAGGTAPLQYRWQKDGVALPDQTGAVLTLGNVQLSQAGAYRVTVSNVAGAVTSRAAVLTVEPPPAVTVLAAQRIGTKLVDIDYDIVGLSGAVSVELRASADGGVTWTVPVRTVSGAWGSGVTAGRGLRMTWDAGADWNGQYASGMAFRVVVGHAEAGFALIPSGSFMMGDALDGSEEPHEVEVSGFQMAQKTVTRAEWNAVRAWGASRGYSDLSAGEAKGDEHPVYSVSWSDAVKWSNARSEMDGLTPCYTVGGNIMKTGGMVPSVNWGASGYRLPTEAEWEKAARGGLSGKRFPWGDTITHGQANYYSMTGLEYDISATRAYHPVWAVGNQPWSAPAGTFAANGYGLYDMAGNGWQWCWDWFGPYDIELAEDPRGSASGSDRIFRGGGWGSGTVLCRTAFRGYYPPVTKNNQIGFRVVRALAVKAESAGTQVWTGARFGVVGGSYAWEEAVMDAERRGGRLAMLETPVKSDAVTGILSASGAWPRLWIGLTDSAEEGQWRWLDGSALMEANWAPGQPRAAGTSDEDSGMILGSSEGEAAGRWADAASGSRQSYLIEFPWYRVQPLGVPVNGSVEGYGEYEPGAVVELTATAARWYRFTGWSGDVSSAENPLRVVVGRNLVITPVFVPDLPDISLEGEGGALLSSGVEFSDFSTVKSERSLVIRSAGTGVLSGLGWVIEGADASSFSVGASAQAELAPGGSEVLTIRFVPVGDGLKRAVLRIESNDPDENPFIVQLAGAKSTASELWRITHFGSPGNTGDARDSEDPDRDGVPNLMEFATGSDPRVFSMSPGELVKNGDLLEFRYWRWKAALSELSFVREFAGETDGPWAQTGGADEVVLSDDGVMQRVLVTVPAGSAIERRFVRLRVDRR